MMGLRRAARPALVAAALLGLCGWVGRGPRAPLEAALSSAAAGDGAGRIYKVTFLSLNASADGAFLERVGGFSGVTDVWHRNVGGAAAGAACAVRQTAEALGAVQIHLVEDGFAAGAVPAEAWVDGCFNALHGDLGAPAWGGWDDFMSAGTAFYYDDLTPVAAAAARDGTPFVGRRYANPRDGLPMYAMFLNLPRSGSIVEFHSAALDGRLAETHFSRPFSPDECEVHHAARSPVAALNATYRALYAAKGIPTGATVPYLFRVSTLLPDANATAAAAAALARHGAVAVSETAASADGACATSRVVLSDVDGAQTVDLLLNSRATLRARDASAPAFCDAATYAAYVAGLHAASFGVDAGWDRFIDRHVGVATNATSLDAHARALDGDGVGWHAHLDTVADGVSYGSAWTALAMGGLGLEVYAPSDGTYFADGALLPLNFCNATTDCASFDACAEAVVVSSSRQRYSFS